MKIIPRKLAALAVLVSVAVSSAPVFATGLPVLDIANLGQAMQQVAALRTDIHGTKGPLFAQIKIAADKLPLVLPPRDGTHLKNRFREALLGKVGHFQR